MPTTESKTRPTTTIRTHNSQPTSHLESIAYRVDGQPHWAAATAKQASPPLPRLTDAIRAQARGLGPFWAATDALNRLSALSSTITTPSSSTSSSSSSPSPVFPRSSHVMSVAREFREHVCAWCFAVNLSPFPLSSCALQQRPTRGARSFFVLAMSNIGPTGMLLLSCFRLFCLFRLSSYVRSYVRSVAGLDSHLLSSSFYLRPHFFGGRRL